MKKNALKNVALVCALTLFASVALAGDSADSGWFDFENCVFCKNLSEDPDLLANTSWENHEIANGSMNIMIVPAEYKASMEIAMASIEDVGTKMHSGEIDPMTANMCEHCQSYGAVMMSGAKIEEIKGEIATVTLVTSDDPAVVAKIHEMVKRNNAEMAKMGDNEHPSGEHPKGDHPKGDHPKGDHPKGN